MQMPAATVIAVSAIARASSDVCLASARAAARAYPPPDPMPTIPSSGSIRSPLPDSRNVDRGSSDDEHRLETAEDAVGSPILRQLHGRSLDVAAVLFQFRLEPGEERKGIGRGTGKAGQHLVVVQAPDLPRRLLDDRVAEGHLAVAGQDRPAVVSNRENRCAVVHGRQG